MQKYMARLAAILAAALAATGADAQVPRSFRPAAGTESVILGSGDVQKAITEGRSEGAIGTGSLGYMMSGQDANGYIILNYSSARDSIVGGYGSAILAGAGSAQLSATFDIRIHNLTKLIGVEKLIGNDLSLHLYNGFGASTWVTDSGNANLTLQSYGVGITWYVAQGKVGSNTISAILDAGLTGRILIGPIKFSENADVLKEAVGTSSRGYIGAEVGGTVIFNSIILRIGMAQFGGEIDGLSGGELLPFAAIQANIALN